MLRDSGMEESRHPKIAELRKFMLNRPSKAVLAPVAEGFGALAAALSKPFVPREVGYVQVDSGQKSRKVRNHMLRSPFKSVIARTAILALVLSIGIAFVSAGMDPSASAQQTTTDPCTSDTTTTPVSVTCNYDENGTDSVASFSGMDPEGDSIAWSLSSVDADDFSITGGVLSFKKSPNYESPTDRLRETPAEAENNNIYLVTVTATEVPAPGTLGRAQSTDINVTVTVKNVDEPGVLELQRLQVRAAGTATGGGEIPGSAMPATLNDPDGAADATPPVTATLITTNVTWKWYVPKVSRPILDNDAHWVEGIGAGQNSANYTPAASDAGKYLRLVATYSDGFGGGSKKAYAKSAYPVGSARTVAANNAPTYPFGTPGIAPNGFSTPENIAVGTTIGTVAGGDTDTDILSYDLTGNNDDDLFDIDIATGRISVAKPLDFETATDRNTAENATGKQYRVTVTVYDSLAESPPTRDVDITVTDINEAPKAPVVSTDGVTGVTVAGNTYKVDENRDIDDTSSTGTVEGLIATFTPVDGGATTRTDPDATDTASTLKLSLGGPDSGDFKLSKATDSEARRLTFAAKPNYESPADADMNNKYQVSIITTDDEGLSHNLALVIEVENIDEKGSVSLSTEQPAIGQPITATLSDPDMGENSVVWKWERRSGTTGTFALIHGATSATYTPVKSVKDDKTTTADETVNGDEGQFLRVSVTYRDAQSAKDKEGTTWEEGRRGDLILDSTGGDASTDTTSDDYRVGELPVRFTSVNAVREAPEVNQAPTFGSGITLTVPENTGAGGAVGAVSAADPDGDALTYTLSGGADMGSFEITDANRSKGQITVKKGTDLNYEGSQTAYTVVVTATDPFGLSASATVTITVTDKNEKPEVTAPGAPCKQDTSTDPVTVTCDYDENGTAAVGSFSATDPEGDSVAWSLSGADAPDFNITGGALTFKSSPNYEVPKGSGNPADNTYEVTVTATEVPAPGTLGRAQSTDITVTVTVKNVDEPAVLELQRLQVRAVGTATGGGEIAGSAMPATLNDPDGPAGANLPLTSTAITTGVSWQWYVPKVSRPILDNDDHWVLGIGGGQNSANYTPAASDAGKYLRLVATYSDGFGGGSKKAYAKSAYPVGSARTVAANNAPTYPAGTPGVFPAGFTTPENIAVGTTIGTVAGGDTDTDILSYDLTGTGQDDDLFDIDIATGRISVAKPLDFETATDRNTAENATGKQYRVTVTVYDSLAESPPTRDVDITVTDVNEAPNGPVVSTDGVTGVTVAGNTYKVDENRDIDDTSSTGTVEGLIATFTLIDAATNDDPRSDPDATDTASTLKVTLGGPDSGDFKLSKATDSEARRLTFAAKPNYESPADADMNNKYQVSIITTDDEGLSHELALVIEVENIDEPGKVSLSTEQPAIGQPITATLSDPDMGENSVVWKWERRSGTTGTFALIHGATSATYTPVKSVKDDKTTTADETVVGDEGQFLRVSATYRDAQSAKDKEGTTWEEGRRGDLILDSTGGDASTDTTSDDYRVGELPVRFTSVNAVREAPEVNQAPTFGSGITLTVPENTGTGGAVGAPVTANDPDGDALTYTISGGADMGAFEITTANRSKGQITVKKGTELNYEGSQTTYTVEVTASDPFGLSASTTVTITVTDVNEPPTLVLQPGGTTPPSDDTVGGRATVNVVEGTTAIGTYTTQIASPTWSLSGADAGDFSISSGGVLSFRTAPDYESPADANRDNSYTVTVVASNGGGTSATLVVTVTVTNDPSDDGSTFDPLTYDTDNSGSIERSEVIQAIRDYFADTISQADVRAVIRSYFSS